MELHQFVKLEAIFQGSIGKLVCATGETKLWISLSVKQSKNPCFTRIWLHTMIGQLKKPLSVDFPIKIKGNSKRTSGAALQTLLTNVKLCLQRMPPVSLLFLVSSQTDKNFVSEEYKMKMNVIKWGLFVCLPVTMTQLLAWFVHDIWHKYHLWYFKIVSNFTHLTAQEIMFHNFETSLQIMLLPTLIPLFSMCQFTHSFWNIFSFNSNVAFQHVTTVIQNRTSSYCNKFK